LKPRGNAMAARKSSQSQVQDEVQNPELEGVRAWPQEPWRCHYLAERGGDRRVDTTEERSPRRPAKVVLHKNSILVQAAMGTNR
jgi:hypothetical protein